MSKVVSITGAGGFIGSQLANHLAKDNWEVIAIDSLLRGDISRLDKSLAGIKFFNIDVRDEDALANAIKRSDLVIHLAAINGTENFYKFPELVLDVGIRGALAVVNACKRAGVYDLILASSAEVYQEASVVPTPEQVSLMLPDSLNPRYSYGGSKIITELIGFNYGKEFFRKVQIFRPHNIYGPNMGTKHVIPQLILRTLEAKRTESNRAKLVIQGTGLETRAFCYVTDLIDGIMLMYANGNHREIYNIGTDHEIAIKHVAEEIGRHLNLDLMIEPSPLQEGGAIRRCPDIKKMRALGYSPKISLNDGLKSTINWYVDSVEGPSVNGLI